LFFKDDALIVVLHVDDLILAGSKISLIKELKNDLKDNFEMIDLGFLHYFLGLHVWHMADGIFLSWPKYALDMLARSRMSDCKLSPTPFQLGVKLDCESPLVDATLYQQLGGSLIYLTRSRIDISFAISRVFKFMQSHHESHWKIAKGIL